MHHCKWISHIQTVIVSLQTCNYAHIKRDKDFILDVFLVSSSKISFFSFLFARTFRYFSEKWNERTKWNKGKNEKKNSNTFTKWYVFFFFLCSLKSFSLSLILLRFSLFFFSFTFFFLNKLALPKRTAHSVYVTPDHMT